MAIPLSILSGGLKIQNETEQNVYDFIRNFDQGLEWKQSVIEIFQIKYSRQALFHSKILTNATDHQQYCNINDFRSFIVENDIYKMKDEVVKLHKKTDLKNKLKRPPKQNDKQKKELNDIQPSFNKIYNKTKAKFMFSTEMATITDNIYWLTSTDMIILPLITKCVGVVSALC